MISSSSPCALQSTQTRAHAQHKSPAPCTLVGTNHLLHHMLCVRCRNLHLFEEVRLAPAHTFRWNKASRFASCLGHHWGAMPIRSAGWQSASIGRFFCAELRVTGVSAGTVKPPSTSIRCSLLTSARSQSSPQKPSQHSFKAASCITWQR
jgi:hypothetical protein